MRQGSGITVAVVWAGSCGSDSTPGLGTSICFGGGSWAPIYPPAQEIQYSLGLAQKKKKKKKKTNKKKKTVVEKSLNSVELPEDSLSVPQKVKRTITI